MTTTRQTRTRMIVVGVALPVAISLAGVVAVLVSLPLLPDPIAVHWGPSGAPDGFGAPWLALVLPPVIVAGYCAFVLSATGLTKLTGVITVNQKLIVAIAPFLAVVVTGVIAGATVMQRGVADAADAGSIFPVLIGSFVGGIALALASWFLLPAASPWEPVTDTDELPHLDLDDTARAVWVQQAVPARALGIPVTIILVVAMVAGGVLLWFAAPLAAFLVYVLAMGALMVLVIGTLYWRVTVDGRGFRAVSVVGFPRFVIPLQEVESANDIVVRPVGDFGGWGLRWGGRGRFGIILRAGVALEVRRKDGRQLVVTVPRARTGAALLNSLAQRA